MVDFRRWILALAVLALFAGLASAQGQLTCATNVSSVPQLRAEGFTELTGDITFTCTGGNPVAIGAAIPTVNITVFLQVANVTSRLFSTKPNVSEALLLLDEPGSPNPVAIAGFGTAASQTICPTPTTGCVENAATAAITAVGGIGGLAQGTLVTVATNPGDPTTHGFNVFQGIVDPDAIHPKSVTFFGIPVLPPATTGFSRVLRITNIRADVTLLGVAVNNAQPLIAQVSVSNPSALPLTNQTPTVGFVQSGLATTISTGTGAVNASPCVGVQGAVNTVTNLNFTERFGTAFKPRFDLAAGNQQNVPGATYNSESGFIPNDGNNGPIGVADFGTRLKATFKGITGLTVSILNTQPTVPAVPPVTAQLVTTSETTADPGAVALVPVTTAGTATIAANADGTFTAVWEVTAANAFSLDTLTFVATTTGGSAATVVNMSFAPTPSTATFSADTTLHSTTVPIPRFADLSGAGTPLTVAGNNVCRTILLYPFLTDATGSGFDTGIAIANTSADPFGTANQSGTCTLTWFGATTAPASNPTTPPTPNIAAGNTFTMILSGTPALVNFTGYMIASCNFQYAHGFAFISDLGARNFAMGYLALVIPDPALDTTNGRQASPGALASRGSGESVSQ